MPTNNNRLPFGLDQIFIDANELYKILHEEEIKEAKHLKENKRLEKELGLEEIVKKQLEDN